MEMLFVEEEKTDIRVEIVEYIDAGTVRVRSLVGWPFGGDLFSGRAVTLCTQNEKVVPMDKVKIIHG